MKKNRGPKGLMGHHQMNKYTHYGSHRRRREREKREEKLFEYIMVESFPNLRKSKKLNKFQIA